jgi:hypothetical protein
MTEAPEQTPTQDTSTSKELTSPLCVVERYEPSDENWAKIKPRILEMEKACFQDRTKTPPKPYGFEEKTLETLFTRDDGTRHILLLKMGEVIVGWMSARPLGTEHIGKLLDYHPPSNPQGQPFDDYYKEKEVETGNGEPSYAYMAYISHTVVIHDPLDKPHNPDKGASEQLEREMYSLLRKLGFRLVARDPVVSTDPKKTGYAQSVITRNRAAGYTIVFAQEHEGVLAQERGGVSELLPPQEHIVVDIREPIPEETVQAEQP